MHNSSKKPVVSNKQPATSSQQQATNKKKQKTAVKNLPLGKDKLLAGYLPLLWIAILSLIIYIQTLKFDYTYLDDQQLVLQHMGQLKDLSNIGSIFSEDAFHSYQGRFYYRPMLTLSFMIDANLCGGKFSFFHFSNMVFHILGAYFLFLLLIRSGYRRRLSFLLSMIFAVHPVLVQAVAWVPGRNDSLLAVFALPAILFFIKYLQNESVKYQSLHFLFYFLALLTKESAVAVPLIAVIYMFTVKKNTWKLFAINGISWAGITFIWLVIRYNALNSASGFTLVQMITSIWQNLPGIIPYLGKIFIPVKLSVLPGLKDLGFHFFTGIAAACLLVYVFIKTEKQRYLNFLAGFAWFLLFLLPGLVQNTETVPNFAEHRLYLPMMGVMIMVAEAGFINKIKNGILPVLIILVFAILAFYHMSCFKDRKTFWESAVRSAPYFAFSQNNMGAMYYLDGDMTNAEKYFRRAVELHPFEPMANGNLGLVLMNTGRMNEAEKYLHEETKINPLYDNGQFNLGLWFYKSGKPDLAVRSFERTLEVNPYYTDAYRHIVDYYLRAKDTVSALSWIEKAEKNKVKIFEK